MTARIEERPMSQKTLGIIMNGVTGRMGMNQHLIRSVVAIRAEGGVTLSDGSKVQLDPILVGRNAEKVAALAKEHGVARWTTDLDAAIANPGDTIFFDAATTQMRPAPPREGDRRRQARLLREADRDEPRRGGEDLPACQGEGRQERRRAGQALPARPAEAAHAARLRLLRPHAVGARASSATGSSRAIGASRRSARPGTTAPRTAAA